MANKRRPKKTKAPYRRYGPGVPKATGNTNRSDSDEENEKEDEDDVESSATLRDGIQAVHIARPSSSAISINANNCIHGIPSTLKQELSLNLPIEIIFLILKFTTKVDPSFLRLSKLFYYLYLPIIYHSPNLDSYNFYKFVDALTANKSVGELVRCLDLSTIVQSGKNSYVSRILRRCSTNLEVFVAPQTSFGYAPLISLRSCKKIKVLDLRLVSETVNLKELFHSINGATELTHLSFPRSSISCEDYEVEFWPPKLWYLRLSGGISDDFISNSKFPSTVTRLELAHCPVLKEFSVYHLLAKFGTCLTHLSIQYPMPSLGGNSLDYIFMYCPNLVFLQLTVDYCTRLLFSEDLLPYSLDQESRPLTTLCIESSGGLGQGSKLHPDDITIALLEGRLPNLRNVRITPNLGWDLRSDGVSDLVNALEENGGGLYSSAY